MPPGWGGTETTSRLWAADPDLQIVICTAYSDYPWEAVAKRLANHDSLVMLKKPVDTIEVLQLTHALSKKWLLPKQSKSRFAELELRVAERTQGLCVANQKLQQDIAQRKRAEARLAAFSKLSQRLSVTKTAREAGEIIVNVADQLLGGMPVVLTCFHPMKIKCITCWRWTPLKVSALTTMRLAIIWSHPFFPVGPSKPVLS